MPTSAAVRCSAQTSCSPLAEAAAGGGGPHRPARLPGRDHSRSGERTGRSRRRRRTCGDRRVEITGPTERKMTINALNSGARVWLADLEDANTPHWANVVGGQVNLYDAVRRPARSRSPEGKEYALRDDQPARDDRDAAARLAPRRAAPARRRRARPSARWSTSGCTSSTTPPSCSARGSGPYFYLPKMESHLEARLWNDVFTHAQERARHPARHHPGHRADRDDPGRVRDGRDPLRAARPRVRAQRGALGLPVQRHQVLPRRRCRLRAARPRTSSR